MEVFDALRDPALEYKPPAVLEMECDKKDSFDYISLESKSVTSDDLLNSLKEIANCFD